MVAFVLDVCHILVDFQKKIFFSSADHFILWFYFMKWLCQMYVN